MRKLAYLAISFLGLVFVLGVVGCVIGEVMPASEPALLPVSTPAAITAPTVTPAPTPTPTPTPTPESAANPPQTTAPTPAAVSLEGVSVYYGKEPPYVRTECSDCEPDDWIQLVDNENAADPTWQELVAFLVSDETDKRPYVPGVYVCGGFAEDLHNNAEAAGIKASWVALDFEDDSVGHALNVFNTTDRGYVYIDSTGERPEEGSVNGEAESWDK
ncbi:MAG: hypothetical protein V3S51_01175, partial [Dehalococcoidia bacterium]